MKQDFLERQTKIRETRGEEVYQHYLQMFTEFDKNESGSVDVHELFQILQKFNYNSSFENVKQVFEDFDLDNNGQIDFDEFVDIFEANYKPLISKTETYETEPVEGPSN